MLQVVLEALGQRGGAARAAGRREDRVVAGNRADDFAERARSTLRPAAAPGRGGADDDQLLDALDAAQELRGGALEGGERRLGADVGAGPLMTPSPDRFTSPSSDVARDRRLRRLEAALQRRRRNASCEERFLVDQLEEDGLAARFHVRTGLSIHRFY
jgi:hypothetical protein